MEIHLILEFFRIAAIAPGRQRVLRWAAVLHVTVVGLMALVLSFTHGVWSVSAALGHVLLATALVEGATLVGWRLSQWPKSQSLEFLLVSPQEPQRLLGMEAGVGLARLALVTLSGSPILVLLATVGRLSWLDVPVLLLMPYTWGAVTGLGLTAWAYEPRGLRRWGQRVVLGIIVFYLIVGVLGGEKLGSWTQLLPTQLGRVLLLAIWAFHQYNPFGIMQSWMTLSPGRLWQAMLGLEAGALLVTFCLLWRAAARLKGHFHDRHYRPIMDEGPADRGQLGDRPLAWWAVRRVMEYSGRVNIYLAGGFGVLFAIYIVAGDAWPPWLGRMAFTIIDNGCGGIAGLAAGMVVLAGVPAAFQYGLWDSSPHERCKKLELLLLTELDGRDYWGAAWAAAWRRGRGYFAVAAILWLSALIADKITWQQGVAALAMSCASIAFSFALGFRAFTRGTKASGLGMFLTVGMPCLALLLWQAGYPQLAALTPPGAVFAAVRMPLTLFWWLAPAGYALGAFLIARPAMACCTVALREWYSLHHGKRALE